jgi:hypothetical protein
MNENTILHHKKHIEKEAFFNNLKKWIQRASYLLILLFAWLQIKEVFIQNPPLMDDKFIQILIRVVVALWYTSWVFGLNLDIENDRTVIIKIQNRGKLDSRTLGVIISLIISFAVLFELLDLSLLSNILPEQKLTFDFKIECFVIALSLFHFMGRYSEVYTGKMAKGIISENKKIYEDDKDYLGLLSIGVIENYFYKANWLRTRFIAGTFMIIFINIITFTDLGKYVAEKLTENSSKVFSVVINVSANLVIVLSIAFFIIMMEGWNWYKRVIRNFSLKMLTEIKDINEYSLLPKNENSL